MGNSYTRQSASLIVDGQTVVAAPLNAEFNQLQNAFNSTLGHTHSGSLGEGPKLSLTASITGVLPVVNGGFGAIHNLSAVTNPAVGNDNTQGYGPGSTWVNTSTKIVYTCIDATTGAAVWATPQALDAGLTSIAGLTTAADKMIYTTALDTYAVTALTPFARTYLANTDGPSVLSTLGVSTYIKTLVTAADAPTARTTLGLGTIATQNANAVALTGGTLSGMTISGSTLLTASATISGGTITGITDLLVADGGTGASDAPTARTNLGLGNLDNTSDVNKPVSTAQAAADALAITTAAPPGMIAHFAHSTLPTGWLKANGALVSRTTFAALFSKVGTLYGVGDGSTTFALPDFRGYFIRSWDDARGGDSGRTIGSFQASTFASHGHGVSDPGHAHSVYDPGHNHGVNDPGHAHNPSWGGGFVTVGAAVGNIGTTAGGSGLQGGTSTDARGTGIYLSASGVGIGIYGAGTGISIQANGSAETRSSNYACMVCIKY